MKGQSQWVELIAFLSRLCRALNDGLAAKGIQFPLRWDGGTIFPNLDVIWGRPTQVVIREISVKMGRRRSDPGGRR